MVISNKLKKYINCYNNLYNIYSSYIIGKFQSTPYTKQNGSYFNNSSNG